MELSATIRHFIIENFPYFNRYNDRLIGSIHDDPVDSIHSGLEELQGRMTIEGAMSKAMEEHVRNRINRIKEELFFESPSP